jgi:uncharacterized membrane protein YidH (DUF202 family)
MINVHNPLSVYYKNWSRLSSIYHLGFGIHRLGFRDTSQDFTWSNVSHAGRTRVLQKIILSGKLPNGSAMHNIFHQQWKLKRVTSREETPRTKLLWRRPILWIVQTYLNI